MPNWTECEIYVSGDPDEIERFLATVASEDSDLDFNRIVPMPDALRGTAACPTPYGFSLSAWKEDVNESGEPVVRAATPEEQAAIDATGFANWYDWCIDNWGTKWPASHVELDIDRGWGRFHFETPWCEPRPIFEALRESFPMLLFQFGWRYEDDATVWPHSM